VTVQSDRVQKCKGKNKIQFKFFKWILENSHYFHCAEVLLRELFAVIHSVCKVVQNHSKTGIK
jgi:hypothetical protein